MPQLEALYTVEFGDVDTPSQYQNGGVAVLETNRVFGGDGGYYYLGTYAVDRTTLTASLEIVKHNASWRSAFGDNANRFKIKVTAQIQGEQITGHMERLDMPGRKLPVRLTWKAALP